MLGQHPLLEPKLELLGYLSCGQQFKPSPARGMQLLRVDLMPSDVPICQGEQVATNWLGLPGLARVGEDLEGCHAGHLRNASTLAARLLEHDWSCHAKQKS